MLFNSLVFPAFLFVVLTLHWSFQEARRRNLVLLFASYLFYGCWDYRFLSLILFSSFVDYWCGIGIGKSTSKAQRKRYLHISLAVNLGILGVFKYLGFFAGSAADFLRLLGFSPDWPTLHIILPVGISFYTFQTLSYTIDVYRNRCPVYRDKLSFFLFVAFFPQLVAGPIEKANHLLPQLAAARRFDASLAVAGLRFMLLGYLLKSVIADNMAPLVNAAYANPGSYGSLSLLFATWCFAFQIYGDFAGYSCIAIGVAALFGVRLRMNFNAPYLSQSVREFWRRWHISLSSWFAEYVYISLLGGNRIGKRRRLFNVVATFTMSGLWHGANWTFLFWGFLNGLMYFVRKPFSSEARLGALLNVVVCFHLTCFAWVFFRASSLGDAFMILKRLFSGASGPPLATPAHCAALAGAMLTVFLAEASQRAPGGVTDLDRLPKLARLLIYFVSLLALFFLGSFDRQPFIYFQF